MSSVLRSRSTERLLMTKPSLARRSHSCSAVILFGSRGIRRSMVIMRRAALAAELDLTGLAET